MVWDADLKKEAGTHDGALAMLDAQLTAMRKELSAKRDEVEAIAAYVIALETVMALVRRAPFDEVSK